MNFNEVEIKVNQGPKYLTPGVHVVKVTNVESGESTKQGSPFVRLTVENANGETTTGDFYLNGGAFDITAQTLFKFIAAAYNLDLTQDDQKATVKAKLGVVDTKEQLAAKLSSVLVGKPFAMVVKGEWINPTDTSKKSWIKAVLSNVVAPKDKANTLKYDESKHIKGTDASTTAHAEVSKPVATDW